MYDKRFLEQMSENVKYNLTYPYHITSDKLLGNYYHNPEYPNSYHTHSFPEVLNIVYLEPYAFYLTDEDKKFYSFQEIEFIEKVQNLEVQKLDSGYKLITLDLDEKTLEYIDDYKYQNNLTFEEAVIDLLKKFIDMNKDENKNE